MRGDATDSHLSRSDPSTRPIIRATLRSQLVGRFSPDKQGAPMRVQVLSFGHNTAARQIWSCCSMSGICRNPHFVPEIRRLSATIGE